MRTHHKTFHSWRTSHRAISGVVFIVAAACIVDCAGPRSDDRTAGADAFDGSAHVIALGNVREGSQPTDSQRRISEFLFGMEPEPAIGLIKPASLIARSDDLIICDSALGALFLSRLDAEDTQPWATGVSWKRPVAIDSTSDGHLLVSDAGLGEVLELDADGREVRRLRYDGGFRPADALRVANEIWVTNVKLNRIEVFDATSGAHRRSIGSRGSQLGEFGAPLGMARAKDGNVLVVDMLNNRVQVLTTAGEVAGVIGRPGDQTGCFGRPKDVAVAQDGTVFVVDAASQRVHAFDVSGRPITAFGGGTGNPDDLCVPSGIAVGPATHAPAAPGAFDASCHVYVTEQLRTPGVRRFAWRRHAPRESRRGAGPGRAPDAINAAANPHWKVDRCGDCHKAVGEGVLPIAARDVDALCLSCHDGRTAHAEPHPVGRLGRTAFARTPDSWPLNGDRVSCLTCHDIRRHCEPSPNRPETNTAMLRGLESERPIDFCLNCHTPTEQWRISPHQQLASDGGVKVETCGFCHEAAPEIPSDGKRAGHARLRIDSSRLCLSCHSVHWDYFPETHVERPVTAAIRQRLALVGERARVAPPIANDRVTCFSCHNPHERGIFPSASELGAMAETGHGAKAMLRLDRPDLCQACHSK